MDVPLAELRRAAAVMDAKAIPASERMALDLETGEALALDEWVRRWGPRWVIHPRGGALELVARSSPLFVLDVPARL